MKIYSSDHDFPDYHGIPKKIICLWFIPRSGSNYLAAEMRKTGLLGYPLEYFSYANVMAVSRKIIAGDPGQNIYDALIRTRTSPNGAFSYKWNSGFDSRFKYMLDTLKIKTYNLFLDRKDRKRQAESYFIARKYKDWLGSRSDHDEEVSRQDLSETMYFLDNIRQKTAEMLENKEVLGTFYEDFVATPKVFINKILDFVEE